MRIYIFGAMAYAVHFTGGLMSLSDYNNHLFLNESTIALMHMILSSF